MAKHQPSISRKNDEITNNPPITNAEIEAQTGHLRNTIGERARKASIQSRQEEILEEILE